MIGVSPKQVKRAAINGLLPPAVAFRVRQTTGRPGSSALAGLDHLIIVAPKRIPTSLWRQFPGLRSLQQRVKRLGTAAAGRVLRGSLKGGGTAVTLGLLPAPARAVADTAPDRPSGQSSAALPNTFKLLKLAGDLVADALSDEPRSIGVVAHGFEPGDAERIVTALVLALGARAWKSPEFRKESKPIALKTVQVLGLSDSIDLTRTHAEIDGANLVRWLTALPANKLTATAYRELLATLASQHGWEFRWLDEAALEQLKAGAFLAVCQGNATREAGIAHLRYRPDPKNRHPDLALVGKGIIFDTGGTNTKTFAHMLDMHMDMSGSAVALAVLQTLTRLKSPLAIDCWLAITENRTGPTAYKQRDVVTASNGVTIEIIHTDAEGRMVLADTLALAGREKPGLMIDYATLTGACVHALSERYSGVFTNREQLNDLLIGAGRNSGERVWPFPMDEDFDDDLKSRVADITQCSVANEADQILASRFLRRFVPEATPWIHVDLAAVMRKDGLAHMPGGFTGFGVRYSLALLLDHGADLHGLTRTAARVRRG